MGAMAPAVSFGMPVQAEDSATLHPGRCHPFFAWWRYLLLQEASHLIDLETKLMELFLEGNIV